MVNKLAVRLTQILQLQAAQKSNRTHVLLAQGEFLFLDRRVFDLLPKTQRKKTVKAHSARDLCGHGGCSGLSSENLEEKQKSRGLTRLKA